MDWENDEWRSAVRDMSELERAPYDEPEIYGDALSLDGVRL